MKQKESLLKNAQEKFPNAISDVEAVDLLAREVYLNLTTMKDKESEQYYKLATKYRELRQLYKHLCNVMVEKESNYKKVS